MSDEFDGNIVWFDFSEGREQEPTPLELVAYVEDQDEALGYPYVRHTEAPDPPWPAQDNPMLGYLTKEAARLAGEVGAPAAMTWLATLAWFEGHLDGLAASRAVDGGNFPPSDG
jgi:hypothetical protein